MPRHAPDDHAHRCRDYADRLIGPLRERARGLGYALGVHGSLAYDIDLIAVPWTRDAVDARALAEALRVVAESIIGYAFLDPLEAENEHFHAGMPGAKPHGRLVWAFHLGGGPYIDLSVMPRGNGSDAEGNALGGASERA
jgi:hypothetical protein